MSEEFDVSTDTENAPSMDDTIRATLADIESRNTPTEEPEASEVPEETQEQKDARARDEKGRFVPKQDQPEQIEEPATVGSEQAAPVAIPPELQRLGLRKEEATAYMKADPVLQQAFLRRSEEMHKGIEQFREKAQFADSVSRAIQPFAQNIQAAGVSPDVAIHALFSADAMLRSANPQQKAGMIYKLMQDYQVNPQDLLNVLQSPQQSSFNPEVFAMQQQLQQMKSWVEQQSQAREQMEQQQLNSEIERFAADPANVHFEAVREHMAALLQSGLAKDLPDAYQQAVYANPTIRARVLAEQQAKAEADRKAEALKKAQAAKQAASVNLARKGTLPAARPVGSMEDTIREKARELGLSGF